MNHDAMHKIMEFWPKTDWPKEITEEFFRRLAQMRLSPEQINAALVNLKLSHKYKAVTTAEVLAALKGAEQAKTVPTTGANVQPTLTLPEHLKLVWNRPDMADEDVMWHYAYNRAKDPRGRPVPVSPIDHALSFEAETRMLCWPRGQQLSVLEMYSTAEGIEAVKAGWSKVDAECDRRRPVPAWGGRGEG